MVGAFSIGFLLRYLRHAGLGIFVVYRLLLAALVIATVLLAAISLPNPEGLGTAPSGYPSAPDSHPEA
jgi:hypothetical protein